MRGTPSGREDHLAALDQSQERAYSPARRKLAVMFGAGGRQYQNQRVTNTVPAQFKRYRG